jgi:5-methylcytosine-specific restriction endonuclease McrA
MTSQLLRPVLVLDAGYQAVNVVPMRRALRLLAAGRAIAVEEDESVVFHSERWQLKCPVVIRLFIAVAHRLYRALRVRFSKRNVFARDGYRCQYCGSSENLTLDHVVPRSRRHEVRLEYGINSWQNCVTACLACNLKKGDRLPEEVGMKLRRPPAAPKGYLPLVRTRQPSGLLTKWNRFLRA